MTFQDEEGKDTITQWDLVITGESNFEDFLTLHQQFSLPFASTGVALVNQIKPLIWTNSFRKVNLDPRVRLSFDSKGDEPCWIDKIRSFLTAGQVFKTETKATPQDKYNCLATFWHGMSPQEKQQVMCILEKHDFEYTVECLEALHKECQIIFSQMNDLRVCILIAQDHPKTLSFGLPTKNQNQCETQDEVARAKEAQSMLTKDLDSYNLVPLDSKGKSKFTGEELLNHMVKHPKRRTEKGGAVPTAGLNVHLYKDSLECINPSKTDLLASNILRLGAGEGARRKCAARKINNLGSFVGTSEVINSDENITKMTHQLKLADSIAKIHCKGDADKQSKIDKELIMFERLAPGMLI